MEEDGASQHALKYITDFPEFALKDPQRRDFTGKVNAAMRETPVGEGVVGAGGCKMSPGKCLAA
ncbi:MAG: hypothetical protein HRU81_04435 [Gammaproteobacteria bacterium]|nr:MAG: hypothetical protein HRU81_04435 [Gammaproteobacteria bacterium]